MSVAEPSRLSDVELVDEVARLARCEREATATLISHLAELYARRLHEHAGYSSLFTYCTRVLRLSEHEAYDRMKAAQVVRRYPSVLGLLAAGCVSLTTIRLLAPHLTPENREELFAAAAGKSKREVQEMLARRFPQPDVASSVRKLPTRRGVPMPMSIPSSSMGNAAAVDRQTMVGGAEPKLSAGAAVTPAAASSLASAPAPPRPLLRPLAADRYQITFTASMQTCEMLELARDLLRHALPSGDPAEIVARALDVLVHDLVRQKYAATDRSRSGRGQAEDSRNIPAEVKRAVFVRDRGRCVFVGTNGRRCGERAFVEFHHVRPYAEGGLPTVDNMELRCGAHNRYEAALFYEPISRYRADVVREPAVPYGRVPVDTVSFRNESASGAARPPTARANPRAAP